MDSNSIILIGPRCTGKTSVGKDLSHMLQVPFVDADTEFAKSYGTISDFVGKYGWPEFRKKESEIIDTICGEYRCNQIVLTPGGGAVAHDQGEEYRKHNEEKLKEFGRIFYLLPLKNLEESALILTQRMKNDSNSENFRPALTKESDEYKEMLKILKKRHELYSKAAHTTILTGGMSPQEISNHILEIFE